MKIKLFILLVVVLLRAPSAVFAHKPLLTVEDNGDGTIYVETGFSDGSSGAGHKIILKHKETGDVLSEQTVPEEGYIEEIPMPNSPYTITFDAGPGHVVVKDGPFSAEAAEAAETTAPAAVEAKAEASPEEKAVEAPAAPPQPAPVQAAAAEAVQPVQQPMLVSPSGGAAQPLPVQTMVTTAAVSPGVEMAMKMMMTSQMVTALGVLVVLGAVMFIIGYVVGKDSGKTRA
ncbi:MAG: hypothetical protein RBT80_15090 [Candidatus Vecturithrix sp.]|jgi:hypothetical protein|nr:hypothetical protein [Candidatus Vecturithrix sp.]